MIRLICNYRYCMRKLKHVGIKYLHCIAKTGTFLLWVFIYMIIMRLTIFKTNKSSDSKADGEKAYQSNETEQWQNKWAENFEDIPMNEIKNYADYTDEEIIRLEKEYEDRRRQVWKTCVKYSLNNMGKPNHWEFFIAPQHGLIWCNIFKAASSSWMYKFNILGGHTQEYLKKARETPLILARRKFPRPSLEFLETSLPGAISFITVREPFERLLSAYRNKLERYRQKYYRKMGHEMIKRYRNETELRTGTVKNYGPTFFEFVRHITDEHKAHDYRANFDEHWVPYYQFCTPCNVNFTVVSKVETLERDTDYIVHQAGLEDMLSQPRVKTIMNKARDGKDTRNLLRKYFGQLDRANLDDLMDIYGIDFEMFGYDPSVYYNFVRADNISQAVKTRVTKNS